MEFNLRSTSLFLAIVTVALSAGLFYAWSISAIPGFKRIPDKSFLVAMQSINRAILNPWFFIIFFGPVFLLSLSTYLQFKLRIDDIFYLVFAATVIYILGNICVTMFGNVPLNEMLDKADLSSMNETGLKSVRSAFEDKWNSLNHIRAFFSVLSFVLLLLAVFRSRALL